MNRQEKHYATLAPVLALAGVFAHPIASTVIPLIAFFLFNRRNMQFAGLVAIRAADLAFSIQLFIVMVSALLAAYLTIKPMTDQQAHTIFSNLTLLAVAYLIMSLLIGAIQSFRGKHFKYVLSLKIAERVLHAFHKL